MYTTCVGVNMLSDKVDNQACYANLLIVQGLPVQYPVSLMDAANGSRSPDRFLRLLDQMRDRIRLKHYSRRMCTGCNDTSTFIVRLGETLIKSLLRLVHPRISLNPRLPIRRPFGPVRALA